ncbi:MAG: hypothetical protein ACYTEX_25710 [Planctomycetota bacterium]|jgi:hypothetical protein
MANPEILIAVGPTPGGPSHKGNFRDGEVMWACPPGVYITPAEVMAYWTSGDIPASIQALPREQRQALRRTFLRNRYLWTHTAAEIAAYLTAGGKPCTEADAAKAKANAQRDSEMIREYGCDTSHAIPHLRTNLAVAVTNLATAIGMDVLHLRELNTGNLPDDWRVSRPPHRRCWLASDWRSFVTPAQQAIIGTQGQLWTCKRGSPIDATTLLSYEAP